MSKTTVYSYAPWAFIIYIILVIIVIIIIVVVVVVIAIGSSCSDEHIDMTIEVIYFIYASYRNNRRR